MSHSRPVPPAAITGCILARNEAHRIEPALESLQGWTEEILVIDNESEDDTVEVARRYADLILTAARATHFDAARNLAIPHAAGEWIFYLDADERVPERLGRELRRLVREEGDRFEALVLPFQHHFCGKWMEHSGWYPGYTRPQLLKNGRFRYNERLHSGVEVDGRTLLFPADDPELAIVHYSYDDLHHYLEKLNRYTDGEAESLLADGAGHTWQAQLAHFVHDWVQYYDRGRADRDGMHGFVLSFMSAFYRFASRAKLWDLRRQRGDWTDPEPVPADVREMLGFMLRVLEEGTEPWLARPHGSPSSSAPPRPGDPASGDPVSGQPAPAAEPDRLPLVWHAPAFHPCGYGDEARQFLLGLLEAGEPVSLLPADWGPEDPGLPAESRTRLEACMLPRTGGRGPAPLLFVSHTLPLLQEPAAGAGVNIARTMFETDRLPPPAVERLNRMDRVWVPSEFNRETFVRSGVDPEKLAVIPGCLDPAPFAADVEPWPLPIPERSDAERLDGETPGAERRDTQPFTFLSVFDWTRHKGWDVLLPAFAREFGDCPEVRLVVKTWSSYGYSKAEIRRQADALLRKELGEGLDRYPNIQLWQELIPASKLPRLYRAADAFVLPTRGEGWCRPLMEAMAAGLPTVATAWSGLTAFHDARVGFPVACRVVPVSEAGAREIPLFAGHAWAEPDAEDLRRLLRRVVDAPEEARRRGQAAQRRIQAEYSRSAVAGLLKEELEYCRRLAARKEAESRSGAAGSQGSAAPRPEARVVPEPTAPASPTPAADRPESGRPAPAFRPKARPLSLDPVPSVDFRELLGRPLRVVWEGSQAVLSSLARVNREFCRGLLAAGDIELSLCEPRLPWADFTEREDPGLAALLARRDAPLSGSPDVTLRHFFPPDWRRPAAGKLVVMQPWEYGYLPAAWVAGARHADSVWAYSRSVRDVYVRSGVPAEQVRVVPLGFDPAVFTPEGARLSLGAEGRTRFLFVGGALDRKGADLLLEAYGRAFTPADPVSLVVKDMGTRTFYQGGTFAEAFRKAAADPRFPEVLYRDDDLSDAELAALYRSASCLVLPYRGEGFALPPLEAMACGLLPVVTCGGPTDDYVDDETALRVPYRRKALGGRRIGAAELALDCVGDPWLLEPDRDALVAALRWVHEHPEEARERGLRARERVATAWTWEAAVARARQALREVVCPEGPPARSVPQVWRPQSEQAREEEIAQAVEASVDGAPTPVSAAARERHSSQPELSLCMIVRDEAPRLRECLESIRPHVDELVVVDTGSRDRTREIAHACGARVYDFPWCDDFAAARNASLSLARGAWLFWMDADDVIDPDCGARLRELVRRHPARDAAYHVQVRIPPGPGEFSPSVVDHVKLFPNRPEVRFEHRIHEQVLPSLRQAGIEVRFSDLYVTHRNYDRSPEGQAKKRQRDFRLLELDLRDRPDHPFVLFNLGMTYLYATHDYEVAAQYLRRCLERSHPADSIIRKAYAMLTQCHVSQGERELAIQVNEAGREHYPEDAELLFQAGQLYQEVGRWSAARRSLERLLETPDAEHYRSVDVGLRTYRARHELALLYARLGDAPHCARALRELAAEQPEYVPARLDLVETLVRLGERKAAAQVLQEIPPAGVEAELARLRELLGPSAPGAAAD